MGGFEPTTFRSESDNTNHYATEATHNNKKKKADGDQDVPASAPPKLAEKTEKRCSVCLVPVKQHVGKHGPNNCLGQAFVEAFRDLAPEIKNLRRHFEVERMEAKDREARLVNKVADLSRQLNAAQERSEHLALLVQDLQREESRLVLVADLSGESRTSGASDNASTGGKSESKLTKSCRRKKSPFKTCPLSLQLRILKMLPLV